MTDAQLKYPHDTDPDIFREALSYSEADKGFTSTLIEKDYYCSLVLHYFFSNEASLVFKGRTDIKRGLQETEKEHRKIMSRARRNFVSFTKTDGHTFVIRSNHRP